MDVHSVCTSVHTSVCPSPPYPIFSPTDGQNEHPYVMRWEGFRPLWGRYPISTLLSPLLLRWGIGNRWPLTLSPLVCIFSPMVTLNIPYHLSGLSLVTERCEFEMHNVRNSCLSGMDHVYHTCLDKTSHTKEKCNQAVSTVINGGTCDVLQGNQSEWYKYFHVIQWGEEGRKAYGKHDISTKILKFFCQTSHLEHKNGYSQGR
jgi:hypothetical protein